MITKNVFLYSQLFRFIFLVKSQLDNVSKTKNFDRQKNVTLKFNSNVLLILANT